MAQVLRALFSLWPKRPRSHDTLTVLAKIVAKCEKKTSDMPDRGDANQARRALTGRSVLDQNRDFFDQFFTRVVRSRFKAASDESASRRMTIIAGSCTAARCQLMANGHLLVMLASSMASTAPEIQISCLAPDPALRPAIRRALRYQPPTGWLDSDSAHLVGDLTTWLDTTIASFLEWSAATLA